MEIAVQNDGASVNQRTALGVVVIDPSSGAAITDFGGAGDAGDAVLPPNAAEESGGNLAAIATAAGHQGDATWNGKGNGGIIAILKAIWSALGGTLNVQIVPVVPVIRMAALASASTAGTLAAGAMTASFANTGSAAASVAGGTLPAGCAVTFDVPAGNTLGAIAYDATGTTLMISTVA